MAGPIVTRDGRDIVMGTGRRWLLPVMLGLGCGGDPPPATPTPAPTPPTLPAQAGTVEPAPHNMRAFGREAFATLQRDDWNGYTNLLVTRADMMGLYGDDDGRGDRRARRKKRRMVWRRVNRLRDGEAEEGWTALRRAADDDGLEWDATRLVDVRHAPGNDNRLPSQVTSARLILVLEHRGANLGIDLGTCVRADRGWVSLYPMQWMGPGTGTPIGESLMSPDTPSDR